jgi:hypothetical protein
MMVIVYYIRRSITLMLRRTFLGTVPAVLTLARRLEGQQESVTATATQDSTPRVGIVLSSFAGSADHDGTPIAGLAEPRPIDATLTDAQVEAMVLKALALGQRRDGGLASIVGPEDWVLVLAPSGLDTRVLGTVVGHLRDYRRGQRFTFSGTASKPLVAELGRKHPRVRFDFLDLTSEPPVELPIPDTDRTYRIAKCLQQCDRVITIGVLKKGGLLGMGNYLAVSEAQPQPQAIVDLFSVHPSDYALACASHLILAGANAIAVETVAVSVLGDDPAKSRLLELAWKRGFGVNDVDSIWTRGNEIEEARKAVS